MGFVGLLYFEAVEKQLIFIDNTWERISQYKYTCKLPAMYPSLKVYLLSTLAVRKTFLDLMYENRTSIFK